MKGFGSRLILVLGGIVAASGLAEILLRMAAPESERERRLTVEHPRYGHVRRDSWIFSFEPDSSRADVSVRGQIVPFAKRAGERRWLFIGDSGTEGPGVTYLETFPIQFQQLVNRRAPASGIRAINAGVWGMTTRDEHRFLADRLVALRPDEVVLGVFLANDLNFTLAQTMGAESSTLWAELREHSALAHTLDLSLRALWRRFPALSRLPSPGGLADERGLLLTSYPEGELSLYWQPPSALAERGYEVFETLLSKFVELARAHEFRFRVVLIPSPSAVLGTLTIPHHPELARELADRGVVVDKAQLDFAAPARRVRAICGKLGVSCVDPTDLLRRLGPAAFLPGDEHLSALGHQGVARALVDATAPKSKKGG